MSLHFSHFTLVISILILIFGFSNPSGQDLGLAQQAAPSPRPTLTPMPRPSLTPTTGPPTETPVTTPTASPTAPPPDTETPGAPHEPPDPPTATVLPTLESPPILPVAGDERGMAYHFAPLPVGILLVGLIIWALRREVVQQCQ